MNLNTLYDYCQGNIIPLDPLSKKPQSMAWVTAPTPINTHEDIHTYLLLGNNIGYRIPTNSLVIDVDPKNGGLDSYAKLPYEIHSYPIITQTPSGGFHIYTRLPEGVDYKELRSELKGYKGIDFLHYGAQVVLPGSSLSPELVYTLHERAEFPIPETPLSLINLLKREVNTDAQNVLSGFLTDDDLTKLLEEIPVSVYSDNDSWLRLLFACHHATAGQGLEAFLLWSLSDPEYSDQEEVIRTRWDSATVDTSKGSLITVRTLCHELSKHTTVPSWLRIKAGLMQAPEDLFSPDKLEETNNVVDQYMRTIEAETEYVNLIPTLAFKIATDSNLYETHREFLYKVLCEKTKTPITALRKDLKGVTKGATPSDPSIIDDGQIFLKMATNLVDNLASTSLGINPMFVLGEWWMWDGAQWRNDTTTAEVKKQSMSIVQSTGSLVTPNSVKSVVELAEIYAEVAPSVLFNPDINMKLYLKNGLLSYENGGWMHRHHDHINRNTWTINANYIPDCPLPSAWLNFLGQVTTSDHARRTIACAIVYAASGCFPFLRKSFFIYGPKRSGKSTMLNLIESLLGKDNCSALSVSQLGHKFGPAALTRKLANISNETKAKKQFEDDIFKALVSGESIQVEHKFGRSYTLRNKAKFFIASNGFPRVTDESDALFDRLILLYFPNSIPESAADHDLKEKLDLERDQIFNWALRIFTEEYNRDKCYRASQPDEYGAKELMRWKRVNNTAIEWIAERVIKTGDHGDRITTTTAYNDYVLWCKRDRHNTFAKNAFVRTINKHLRHVGDNRGKPVYVGVKLHDIELFEQDKGE